MTKTEWPRIVGRSAIGLLWAITGYLIAYYAALLAIGPDRLFTLLGERAYNALIPAGGFLLLLRGALLLLLWGVPFVLAAAVAVLILRLALPRRRRAHLAVALAVGLLFTASLPLVLFDGWPSPLWLLLEGDDTEFAQGYTAWGFWRVRRGMSSEEVVRTLGEPLVRFKSQGREDEERWQWTRSPNGSDYRLRGVLFKGGRVVEKVSELYVD